MTVEQRRDELTRASEPQHSRSSNGQEAENKQEQRKSRVFLLQPEGYQGESASQSSVISPQSSVISQQSAVISQQSSVISQQSSVISHQSSVISHQSSVISRAGGGRSRQLRPHWCPLTHPRLLSPCWGGQACPGQAHED